MFNGNVCKLFDQSLFPGSNMFIKESIINFKLDCVGSCFQIIHTKSHEGMRDNEVFPTQTENISLSISI